MIIFRYIREIFDDWLTRAASLVCLLIVVIVIFNMNTNISEEYPLLGTLVYALVPVLFIAGGVIFIMAILRFSAQDNKRQDNKEQDSEKDETT